MFIYILLALLCGIMPPALGVNGREQNQSIAASNSQAEDKECQVCAENFNETDRIRVKFDCPALGAGSTGHELCQECALKVATTKPICPFCRAELCVNNAIRLENERLITEQYNIERISSKAKDELRQLFRYVPASDKPYVKPAAQEPILARPAERHPLERLSTPVQQLPARITPQSAQPQERIQRELPIVPRLPERAVYERAIPVNPSERFVLEILRPQEQPRQQESRASSASAAECAAALCLGYLVSGEFAPNITPVEREQLKIRRTLYVPLFFVSGPLVPNRSSFFYLRTLALSSIGLLSGLIFLKNRPVPVR